MASAPACRALTAAVAAREYDLGECMEVCNQRENARSDDSASDTGGPSATLSWSFIMYVYSVTLMQINKLLKSSSERDNGVVSSFTHSLNLSKISLVLSNY